MSSAKPKVINASVFCSTKSFISLDREKVKFDCLLIVLVMFQWSYHLYIMSLYVYNQDLAVDIKQSNFLKL